MRIIRLILIITGCMSLFRCNNPVETLQSEDDPCDICRTAHSFKIAPATWYTLSFPTRKVPVSALLIPNTITVQMICWDEKGGGPKYIGPADTLYPGRGYYMHISKTTDTLTIRLDDLIEFDKAELQVNLQVGQNLLGNPFPYSIRIPDDRYVYFVNANGGSGSGCTSGNGGNGDTCHLYDTLRSYIPAWSGFMIECDTLGQTLTFSACDCP